MESHGEASGRVAYPADKPLAADGRGNSLISFARGGETAPPQDAPLPAALVVLWRAGRVLMVFDRYRQSWELPGGNPLARRPRASCWRRAGSNLTNGCGSSATRDSCWRLTGEPNIWPCTQEPAPRPAPSSPPRRSRLSAGGTSSNASRGMCSPWTPTSPRSPGSPAAAATAPSSSGQCSAANGQGSLSPDISSRQTRKRPKGLEPPPGSCQRTTSRKKPGQGWGLRCDRQQAGRSGGLYLRSASAETASRRRTCRIPLSDPQLHCSYPLGIWRLRTRGLHRSERTTAPSALRVCAASCSATTWLQRGHRCN